MLCSIKGPGIYFGMIDVTGQAGHESVTIDTKLIPYPRDEHQKGVNPVGLVITEFHVLILFPDRCVAIHFVLCSFLLIC